jgi:hypothetical protein
MHWTEYEYYFITYMRVKQKNNHSGAMVFNLFYLHTPRCNFSSTLCPQSCGCIFQVMQSL